MILKARAEKGSVSSGLRSTDASVLGLSPTTGGTSRGDGKYWMTASSRGWTPLFLKAVPQSTGVAWLARVALRSAMRRCEEDASPPPTYASMTSSSNSARAS
jgi:hypothetical protein